MTDSVQINPQTTGPVGPGEESQAQTEEHFYGKKAVAGGEVQTEGRDFAKVELPLSETGPDAPTEPSEDLILGKFKSQDDLAAAYQALEAKLGGQAAPSEAPAAPADGKIPARETPAEGSTGALTDEALASYTKEFSEKGQLSADSFQALETAGIPRALAESHIAGLQALRDQRVKGIFDTAGGQEQYGHLVNWAQENMTPAQVDAYNRVIESGDQEQAVLAVEGLKARAGVTGKLSKPKQLVGKPVSMSTVEPFGSQDSVVNAMQDPRYESDPIYREQVARRIKASKAV